MRFITNYLLLFTLFIVLAEAVLSWFGSSLPAASNKTQLQSEPWELPKLPTQNGDKLVEKIIAANPWGDTAPGTKTLRWRVTGIIKNAGERHITLSFDERSIEVLKVGDTLPDGATITHIEDTQFFVLTKDKKKLTFDLYQYDKSK